MPFAGPGHLGKRVFEQIKTVRLLRKRSYDDGGFRPSAYSVQRVRRVRWSPMTPNEGDRTTYEDRQVRAYGRAATGVLLSGLLLAVDRTGKLPRQHSDGGQLGRTYTRRRPGRPSSVRLTTLLLRPVRLWYGADRRAPRVRRAMPLWPRTSQGQVRGRGSDVGKPLEDHVRWVPKCDESRTYAVREERLPWAAGLVSSNEDGAIPGFMHGRPLGEIPVSVPPTVRG